MNYYIVYINNIFNEIIFSSDEVVGIFNSLDELKRSKKIKRCINTELEFIELGDLREPVHIVKYNDDNDDFFWTHVFSGNIYQFYDFIKNIK